MKTSSGVIVENTWHNILQFCYRRLHRDTHALLCITNSKKIRFCTAKYRKQPCCWQQSSTEQTYFWLQSNQDIATLQWKPLQEYYWNPTETTDDKFVTIGSIGPHSLYFVLQTQKKIVFVLQSEGNSHTVCWKVVQSQLPYSLQNNQSIATLQWKPL
jgi:hypothetical protein